MDLGLFYTDLKDKNLLYKMDASNNIFVVLGDLGSAFYDKGIYEEHKKKAFVSTYPPIDRTCRRFGTGYYENPKESDISWMIGIIILQLKKLNTNIYGHSEINLDTLTFEDNENEEVIERLSMLNNNTLKNIIKGTIIKEPNNRLTLKQILDKLPK
jgi:hypothetical protein